MSYAANAYARTSQVALTPREAEAAILIKAAVGMQAVQDNWGAHLMTLDDALGYNRKVWTLLATSATEADSPLPQELKISMAQLGAFVFTRTLDVLVEPSADKLTALIEINRNLANGLRGNA
ncbi:flagellar biosynthesis regulator FlaF [Methylobacterium indicum]|uniref:flagellar biosynthesis regulator FlaF n=1 Tax=Methylobacterium indicum TaxID=1775910 RepID=UPI0024356F2C|nr:flagellar biosynthesis regulator FlaF [Methylobacterium indicum]